MSIKRLFFFFLLYLSAFQGYADQSLTNLPTEQPVKVSLSLYLWDVSNISERDQTFDATIYVTCKWFDKRLSFAGNTPQIYTEKLAHKKLNEMWWPALDFVNSSHTRILNSSVTISPDGSVEYDIKASGTFFSLMDLRKFPFDEQNLEINIESFLWNAKQLQFIPDFNEMGFSKKQSYEPLRIQSITPSISDELLPYYTDAYSNFKATIRAKRNAGFFTYQTLLPLSIVFVITTLMFFLPSSDLVSRLLLIQGCVLVFVAMKFTINAELPKIEYFTIVDYIFLFAYLCCALAGVMSVYSYHLWQKRNPTAQKLSKELFWAFFLLVCIILIIFTYFLRA